MNHSPATSAPAPIAPTPVIWEVDLARRPLRDEQERSIWELVLCDRAQRFVFRAVAPEVDVTVDWVVAQFHAAAGDPPEWPDRLQAFRPASLDWLQPAATQLGLPLEPTRRTFALKAWLHARQQQSPLFEETTQHPYDPLAIAQGPPVPLPANLWGERWQFAALPAGEVMAAFGDRPIPFRELSTDLDPLALGLASTLPIPGVIVEGGRRSLPLARWLHAQNPAGITFLAGPPHGLLLEAGLAERYVLTTFTDADVATAARLYEARKQESRGLHFLLIQPDDTGMTYTGIWLLQSDAIALQP